MLPDSSPYQNYPIASPRRLVLHYNGNVTLMLVAARQAQLLFLGMARKWMMYAFRNH